MVYSLKNEASGAMTDKQPQNYCLPSNLSRTKDNLITVS